MAAEDNQESDSDDPGEDVILCIHVSQNRGLEIITKGVNR